MVTQTSPSERKEGARICTGLGRVTGPEPGEKWWNIATIFINRPKACTCPGCMARPKQLPPTSDRKTLLAEKKRRGGFVEWNVSSSVISRTGSLGVMSTPLYRGPPAEPERCNYTTSLECRHDCVSKNGGMINELMVWVANGGRLCAVNMAMPGRFYCASENDDPMLMNREKQDFR